MEADLAGEVGGEHGSLLLATMDGDHVGTELYGLDEGT